jgi:enamine deaminase RidA (YjgF/YER057c/UK114 family)
VAQQSGSRSAHGSVEHLQPADLHHNPAYTQVVSVTGPVKTVYVGGQDAVDAQGSIVGKGDLAAQTRQVLANVQKALAAAGAGPEHIIKWNVYLVQGQSMQTGFGAFQEFWGDRPNPPAITGMYVSELAHPDFLVEIDAIAVVPQ